MTIQAVLGHPLTVYGNGSQTRGLINIVDTVECIRLASENPADRGEFRVFNQFTESMSITQIAETIANEYPGRGDDRARRQPARRARGPLLQRQAPRARGPRPQADAALDDADRSAVRRRRAPQGPRRSGGDHAHGSLARDRQRAAPAGQHARPDVSSQAAAGLRGRRVLVTGGSGFIGRHVVSELAGAGAQVRVVDLQPHPDPAVEIVSGDIADPEVLRAAFEGGFDAVVHLAAVTSVLRSLEHPELTYRTNVAGTAGPARGRSRGGRRARSRSPRPTRSPARWRRPAITESRHAAPADAVRRRRRRPARC